MKINSALNGGGELRKIDHQCAGLGISLITSRFLVSLNLEYAKV